MAHSGFKTEQCSETLNALKPFKSVFFSTGCANMMANCQCAMKRSQVQWGTKSAQNAMAHNGAGHQNCPPGWGTRFLDHSDSGTIKT